MPEEPHLYGHLSGLEYLTMVGQLRGLPAKATAERIDGLLRLLSLHGDRHAPLSSYSKGMRQKALLSAALLHNPELLLLDEPFSGLDIGTTLVMRSLIQELAARGKAVLFSSHELEIVERVCERVMILHRGKRGGGRLDRAAAGADGAADAGADFRAARGGAGHGGGLARDRRPDRSMTMEGQQFRVLYRQFLFRMADIEALSAHAQGDCEQAARAVRGAADPCQHDAFGGRVEPAAATRGAVRLAFTVASEHS